MPARVLRGCVHRLLIAFLAFVLGPVSWWGDWRERVDAENARLAAAQRAEEDKRQQEARAAWEEEMDERIERTRAAGRAARSSRYGHVGRDLDCADMPVHPVTCLRSSHTGDEGSRSTYQSSSDAALPHWVKLIVDVVGVGVEVTAEDDCGLLHLLGPADQ